MLISVLADLHFRGKKLQDKISAWEQAVEKMIERKVDRLILAGDTFERRNIADREATIGMIYKAFMDQANRLLAAGIEIVALKGNGKHEGKNGEQPGPLEVFKGTDIKVVDLNYFFRDLDHAIFFIPAIDNQVEYEKLKEDMAAAKADFAKLKNYKMVVHHLQLTGAIADNGRQMPGDNFDVSPAELEDLGADLIIGGHIHKRQPYYVGALTQDDFGDEGNPQGFMIVDTEKRTQEFVEIEAPKYMTIEPEDPEEFLKTWRASWNCDRDYVKLRFKKKPDNYDELISNPRVSVEIIPEREVLTRKVEGVEAGRSDEELLDSYLKGKGTGDADRSRIVGRARELAGDLK